MTGFGRFSVNEARKITCNFSVAKFIYSLKHKFLLMLFFVYIRLKILKNLV